MIIHVALMEEDDALDVGNDNCLEIDHFFFFKNW